MESSLDKLYKSDESGEANDAIGIENANTTLDNAVQSECHAVEQLANEMDPNPSSSNNEMHEEDIDMNDIVLITESLPVIDSSAENNQTIEPPIDTDKACEAQATNEIDNENINIDNIELIDDIQNELAPGFIAEKVEDEPMDIDEILNSLNTDFDAPTNNDIPNEVCEGPSAIVPENTAELLPIEKAKVEEIVLLSDDDDDNCELRIEIFY